jgi:predicted dehydrogenase
MDGKDDAADAPDQAGVSRRSFIQKTVTAAAAVASVDLIGQAASAAEGKGPYPGRVLGANDRIAVAYIGTGAQGTTHVKIQKEHAAENNIVQAAVCDVYQKRVDAAAAIAGLSGANVVRDYRRILERKDIDAVVVSTIDTWHADVACDAMESGKHVYGEKPLARYLEEGFRVYDTVKKTRKVFQVGSQDCADLRYHKAAEWIKAGKLGPLVWAQGSYCRNHPRNSEWSLPVDPEANEQNLDWKTWLGKARKIAFNPEHYFSWHKFYAYNSGILGNLLSHTFLPLLLATGGTDFPRRVTCTGTKKVSTDREITDTTHVLAEMPSGLTFCVVGSTVNEQGLAEEIRGRQATIYLSQGQNRAELRPERPFTEQLAPEDFSSPLPAGRISYLEKNFFDVIRKGGTPFGNIDLAVRAHVILALAEMSERLSTTLLFDWRSRKVTNGEGRELRPISYDFKKAV